MDIISVGPAENKPFAIAKGIRFETESDDIAVALLNKEASNRGYSYLLINNGYGCMCSINLHMADSTVNRYFKKTYEIMTKLFNIDMKNEKSIGGVGCFLFKPRLIENGRIYTGEAAGLQDFLWGFGMRYAINSGFFAAKSIIDNKNYKKLIKQSLSDRLKTSVANRFLVDWDADRYYNDLLEWAKKNDSWRELLYYGYNPSLFTRTIYPFAKLVLSLKFREYF